MDKTIYIVLDTKNNIPVKCFHSKDAAENHMASLKRQPDNRWLSFIVIDAPLSDE